MTKLTELVYLNHCTAMAENKGFGARGPASTGKTETVKDLGRALGRTVIVVNASPE
jgi:dynein heavy chain, axonemal